jgi:hypothetical protein
LITLKLLKKDLVVVNALVDYPSLQKDAKYPKYKNVRMVPFPQQLDVLKSKLLLKNSAKMVVSKMRLENVQKNKSLMHQKTEIKPVQEMLPPTKRENVLWMPSSATSTKCKRISLSAKTNWFTNMLSQ